MFDHLDGDDVFIVFHKKEVYSKKGTWAAGGHVDDETQYFLTYKLPGAAIVTTMIASEKYSYDFSYELQGPDMVEVVNEDSKEWTGSLITHTSCQINFEIISYTYVVLNNVEGGDTFKERIVGLINIDNPAFSNGYRKEHSYINGLFFSMAASQWEGLLAIGVTK